MLRAMAEDDPRLDVDDLEYHRTEKEYTYETMLAIGEKYPDATLCFLAGGDKVDVFPRWHRIEEFLSRFQIAVVKRDGENPEADIAADEFLCQYRDRFLIVTAPDGIEGISSSVVREKFRLGEFDAEKMCHPRVWALLLENGGMGSETICGFFGEYRFLSNFWNAPVEYRGLTYQNNEAAFQAQKCISAAEKVPFTTLLPNEAKRLGREVALRSDWEQVKIGIMEEIVRAKFTQNEDLKVRLLLTGDRRLEEGNTWHDTFWGVDVRTRCGQNHLGEILMKVRAELAEVR